jgi:hypothetical protein
MFALQPYLHHSNSLKTMNTKSLEPIDAAQCAVLELYLGSDTAAQPTKPHLINKTGEGMMRGCALGGDDDARRAREAVGHTDCLQIALLPHELLPPLGQRLELRAQLLFKLFVCLLVAQLEVFFCGVLELYVLVIQQVLQSTLLLSPSCCC